MTPPTVAQGRPEVVTRGVPSTRAGWIERATSADHKSVGLLYVATSLVFLALAAVEFLLMRLQLLAPESSMIEPEIFSRLLSASAVTLVVLFAIPFAIGLIGYIVPLQIGARGVAMPRLNQLSYWLYLAGAVTIYGTFMYAAPESGTLALPPLSDTAFSPGNGTDAWIVGTALALAGFVLFAVNLVVTVQRMRAPGIAWRRASLFSWAGAIASCVLLLVGPAMIAALTMLIVDRRFDGVFFDPGEGGAPLFYEHVGYLFLTGAYLIVVIVAAGIVSEVLRTFSRKPIFSHRAVAASMVAVAVLGLLAWMQNMYIAPLAEGWTIMAMAFALALLVPLGVIVFSWIATIWGGSLRLRAASLYALAAVSTMAFGLAGELAYSVIPVGWALANTTASQGDTLYVLVGGGVFGGFAGLHYWFPKLNGRLLGEGAGKLALALMLAGIHLYVLPMFLAGLQGQPVDIFEYFEGDGLDLLNAIATTGAFVLVLGILLALANAAYSWNHGLAATGHDPWSGTTLEWFALSPPPPHNFDAVPDVRSAEPLQDIREAVRRRTSSWRAPGRAPIPQPAAVAAEEAPRSAAVATETAPEPPPDAPESENGGSAPVA